MTCPDCGRGTLVVWDSDTDIRGIIKTSRHMRCDACGVINSALGVGKLYPEAPKEPPR